MNIPWEHPGDVLILRLAEGVEPHCGRCAHHTSKFRTRIPWCARRTYNPLQTNCDPPTTYLRSKGSSFACVAFKLKDSDHV